MLTNNPFSLHKSQYRRHLNLFQDYINDNAFFLSRMTNDPIETCREFVTKNIKKDGKFPIKDPRVLMLEADEVTGDRSKQVTTLGNYLKEAIQNHDLIAPTYTIFYQPSVRKSWQPQYMEDNKALRSKFKKKKFSLVMAGDKVGSNIADKIQNNRKTANNAISGTYTIGSTPLANPSAHAVLTSTCRVTSGYGNANNEKMIAGNRHYWSSRIVMNNITTIVTHTDYDKLQAVMDKYQLNYPTVDETLDCIKRGAMKYFRDEFEYARIRTYLEKLHPIELAAFVYTGDLYHIRKLNDDFMRGLVKEFINREHICTELDRIAYLKTVHADVLTLALQYYEDEVRGVDFSRIEDNQHPLLIKITNACDNIERVIEKYSDFISVFFTTTNVPASLAYFPSSVRHVAITSDTDSTIFTTQEWVEWYTHDNYEHEDADGVAGIICLWASQTITHLLALMAGNFGINEDLLTIINMKNEFKFDVFIPTDVSKHYLATITIQEGNVYKEPEREIKGVHLKSSNVPISINNKAHAMMNEIMDTVRANKKIHLLKYLKEIADMERNIIRSIKSGSPEFCRFTKIKEATSYNKPPSESPYQYHIFWNEVFGPKYGYATEPPYTVMKINTSALSSPVKIKEWTDTFADRELAKRLVDYCLKNNKTALKTFYIPDMIAASVGIPDEILEAANYRTIIKNLHITFYILLETLGFYIQDDKVTRLVSDYY